jgi:mycobactin lysine-N-oxygenase
MTEEDRREFLRRTDRGVFSRHAMDEINHASNVHTVMGTMEEIHVQGEKVHMTIAYNGQEERDTFDYIVVATGFHPLWFTDLMDNATKDELAHKTEFFDRNAIEHMIDRDLSLNSVEPRLHLPMLAGIAQGPGFPNLSCLGLLSDRILASYCQSSPDETLK